MNKNRVSFLLVTLLFIPSPCLGQGMMEFGNNQAGVAGLGAGLAASIGHGKLIHHSFQATANAQQAFAIQTKAIEQYMQVGCGQEARRQWAAAEGSFRYVLKVIALRDGSGSPKSVPALEHLVVVTRAQNKLDDAINYQKTVVAFEKSAPKQGVNEVIKAQNNLSNLFEQKGDYVSAVAT